MTTPPPFNSGNPQQNPIPPYTPQQPNQAPQKKKTDPIVGAIALVTLVVGILCYSFDWFPSPQIIDFEADIFGGSYYIKLTIIAVWMAWFLPAFGIYKLAKLMSK